MLRDKVTLYHASYTVVEDVDLSLCFAGKDFGRGFYVTTDLVQAQKFVKTAVRKALKNKVKLNKPGIGYVSVYSYREDPLNGLAIYEFEASSVEWLHCVANFRKDGLVGLHKEYWETFDVLIGKIANDSTNQVLTAYINGLYGEPGSGIADETAIRLLLPNKLSNQACFKSEKAIESLVFQQAMEIDIGAGE